MQFGKGGSAHGISVMAWIMLAKQIIKRAGSKSGATWSAAKLDLLHKMPSDVPVPRRSISPW